MQQIATASFLWQCPYWCPPRAQISQLFYSIFTSLSDCYGHQFSVSGISRCPIDVKKSCAPSLVQVRSFRTWRTKELLEDAIQLQHPSQPDWFVHWPYAWVVLLRLCFSHLWHWTSTPFVERCNMKLTQYWQPKPLYTMTKWPYRRLMTKTHSQFFLCVHSSRQTNQLIFNILSQWATHHASPNSKRSKA